MSIIDQLEHDYRRHKEQAEKAMTALDDEAFFHRPGEQVNPIALIVKHLSGNLRSRWTDFLTTDGEKPDRNRDQEFVVAPDDSRANLMARWENSWHTLFATLATLRDADLERTITIRGEPHSVFQAILRGLTHAAYHVGQVLYLARLLRPESPWLTIPPGKSKETLRRYQK